MTRAAIVADGGLLRIYSPFACRDDIKTIPGRRWDPAGRCWLVPAGFLPLAMEILERYCATVEVIGATVPARSSSTSWPEALAAALPPEHRARVYRVLAAVFHPDAGGDAAVMTQINAAFDRQRRRAS